MPDRRCRGVAVVSAVHPEVIAGCSLAASVPAWHCRHFLAATRRTFHRSSCRLTRGRAYRPCQPVSPTGAQECVGSRVVCSTPSTRGGVGRQRSAIGATLRRPALSPANHRAAKRQPEQDSISALKNLDRRDLNLIPGCATNRSVCMTDMPDDTVGPPLSLLRRALQVLVRSNFPANSASQLVANAERTR